MSSHFLKLRGRAVVWPVLAALLLFVGLIGATRGDGQARLTAEEMNTSRGTDQGQGIIFPHCDSVPVNHARTAACGQLAINDKDACRTCHGGKFQDVGSLPGGNVAGQGPPQACGKARDGICRAYYRGGKFLKKVVCQLEVPPPGKREPGCIPAAPRPQAQSVYVAGGSGSGGDPGATAQPR